MNIEISQSNEANEPFETQEGWHILTVAESGFSMLSGYASEYGIEGLALQEFEELVNRNNESGSLYPKAPISAVPCKYFRELSDSSDPSVLEEFATHILEFLTANSNTIKSENLAIDFHVSQSPVPQQFIDTTLDVIKAHQGEPLKNICIY